MSCSWSTGTFRLHAARGQTPSDAAVSSSGVGIAYQLWSGSRVTVPLHEDPTWTGRNTVSRPVIGQMQAKVVPVSGAPQRVAAVRRNSSARVPTKGPLATAHVGTRSRVKERHRSLRNTSRAAHSLPLNTSSRARKSRMSTSASPSKSNALRHSFAVVGGVGLGMVPGPPRQSTK